MAVVGGFCRGFATATTANRWLQRCLVLMKPQMGVSRSRHRHRQHLTGGRTGGCMAGFGLASPRGVRELHSYLAKPVLQKEPEGLMTRANCSAQHGLAKEFLAHVEAHNSCLSDEVAAFHSAFPDAPLPMRAMHNYQVSGVFIVRFWFILLGHGAFFPLKDNMLFFFANMEPHGTEVIDFPEGHAGCVTMAHAIPTRLWSFITAKGLGSAPDTRRSEPLGDDELCRHAEPSGDDDTGPASNKDVESGLDSRGSPVGDYDTGVIAAFQGELVIRGVYQFVFILPRGFRSVITEPKDAELALAVAGTHPDDLVNFIFTFFVCFWPINSFFAVQIMIGAKEGDAEDWMYAEAGGQV
ncbi:MAG: hypothetical protein BJ554DRAFT_2439 [Olpidium bornovanus]|uniref:Uncharacterized protein n=1 Tax=Olpidium bornovanus TaxID=278681 RepID=A0A8H7ZQX4_9FUNG|nr:MAG: hypothetical protein BJ554DRAFT_2439 [Olpidium bornovanus]